MFRCIILWCLALGCPSAVVPGVTPGRLSFLVIGDWGGTDEPPYYLPGQLATAQGMAHVAAVLDSQFVVALGDNFYVYGIRSNAHDARFQRTFEDIYTAPALQTPWHVVAGNHDHYGNVTAQMAYAGQSVRWKYPDLYHTWTLAIPNSSMTVQVILIDTVVLEGSQNDAAGNWLSAPGFQPVLSRMTMEQSR